MSRDPRDWQADMKIAQQLESWKIDPGGVEDGAAFYTIEKDGIQTIIHADNMLEVDVELLGLSIQALPYWLQEASKLASEFAYAKQQAIEWNNKAVSEKERADIAEANVKKLKEDNARWLCKHTTAEQKYLTQSNVIAELRGRAEKAEAMHKEWMEAYWSLHAKYQAINLLDMEGNGNV